MSRVQPRGGRAVRFYRAIATSFVVGQEWLAAPPRERWEKDMREALQALAIRRERALVYSSDEEGRPRVRIRDDADDTAMAPALDLWKLSRLSRSQCAELARDLQMLASRYGAPSSAAGGEAVLIHLAFVPVAPRG